MKTSTYNVLGIHKLQTIANGKNRFYSGTIAIGKRYLNIKAAQLPIYPRSVWGFSHGEGWHHWMENDKEETSGMVGILVKST
jgi:hypothetical protein